MTKADAENILKSGKELFDYIIEKDMADGSARSACWKLRRDARQYISGEWEATPERAREVIEEHLFEILYQAGDLGIIPHQTDLEVKLCCPSARLAVLAGIPVAR